MSQYVHFGIILITVPNLIVIILMVLVFIAAVALKLPHPPSEVPGEARSSDGQNAASPGPPTSQAASREPPPRG